MALTATSVFFTVAAGTCTILSTTAGATAIAVTEASNPRLNECREILHEAMNILDALLKESDIDISDRLVRQLRYRHETLTASVGHLQKYCARTHFYNAVAKLTIIFQTRTLRSNCVELCGRVKSTSDIARNKRMGNGSLQLHRTSSNYSLITITSHDGVPVAVESDPSDIPLTVLRELEAMDASTAAAGDTTLAVVAEEAAEGQTADEVDVTDSDGTSNHDGSLTVVGIVVQSNQEQSGNVEVPPDSAQGEQKDVTKSSSEGA
ncbi:uncharacterized protein LAESUDRAFT_755519 [Laetiporus sulphureus 93-53]|uniref:Fungal N-terminal domain-containing protein n=1 Tax=Laetiporus sulphureus 93-53 TaxID=1314785 RepID=A0A165GVA9_9APHY|nr:uncharacterized protein LAESUDRAFT_755519 [Laetiporus sulphureus 93-53]KZT10867.1 hypothetical protein LAESUDRAFT_755519 [Laetiporus sulphureus 93-53]